MKKRSTAIGFLVILVLLVVGFLYFTSDHFKDAKLIKEMVPQGEKITEVKEVETDSFISKNFPSVVKVYHVGHEYGAVFTETVGYMGTVRVLSLVDRKGEKIKEIKIISHEDTPQYADPIYEHWFTDRFKNVPMANYLKLVVLDQVKPEEIIQVTGATITSQAVVNGVNAAIGVMQYLDNGVKMGKVGQTVPKELWNMDDNSFAINWEGGSVRLTMEDMKKYPQVTVDAVLKKTTGTKSKIKIQGPELSQVLKEEGVDLKDYAGIGITGRDGYYTMVDEDKLSGSILLGWKFNDEEIRKDEKPIRVCLPDEMGPYWVKLVTTIDLYKEISPKNITKVHMFDALTRDIEPYEYEYYGSKDKSIEVGKILAKFESVDLKGFFSMYAVDGLEKNETISLVRDRYFIKVEGENAPMNIAPNFKLGMNVKNMSHFSTTKDSVIFPWKMEAISRTKKIEGKTYLYLEDVLVNAGLLWKGEDLFTGLDTEGHQFQFQGSDLDTCYISQQGKKVTFLKDGQEMTTDLLTIEKMQ